MMLHLIPPPSEEGMNRTDRIYMNTDMCMTTSHRLQNQHSFRLCFLKPRTRLQASRLCSSMRPMSHSHKLRHLSVKLLLQ